MRRVIATLVMATSAAGIAVQSQFQVADVRKMFEVISIRENTSGATAMGWRMLPDAGYFATTNSPVIFLIVGAFDVRSESKILNGPDWIRTNKFDIEARASESDVPVSSSDMRQMLRALLEDRFALRVSTETQTSAGFALLRDRTDGSFGEQLRVSAVDCAEAEQAGSPDGPQIPAIVTGSSRCAVRMDQGEIEATSQPMSVLAQLLSTVLKVKVMDRTHLTDRYDFSLRWRHDPIDPPGTTERRLSDSPDVFTAVREQLGLLLAPEEVPAGALLIEHIERPSPN